MNLKPRSRIDHLLESLLSETSRDQRFLPVFNLIYVRHHQYVNVLEAKTLACLFVDPLEIIGAWTQSITLLEEQK